MGQYFQIDSSIKPIGYCRRSTKDQERSLEIQRKYVTDTAKQHHLQLYTILEESVSASKKEVARPQFELMLKLIKDGVADTIVAWRVSRLSRNSKDPDRILDLLSNNKLKLIITSDGIYDNSANAKGALFQKMAEAYAYTEELAENVDSGSKVIFDAGYWPGLAPLGYVNKRRDKTHLSYIDIDSNNFFSIKQALKNIASGSMSPQEAFRWLNDDCHCRTPERLNSGGKPLALSAFYKLLKDPFYKGIMRRRIGGVMCENNGQHQPMITAEEYNQIQQVVAKGRGQYVTHHVYAYKKLLSCGECGGDIGGQEKVRVKCSTCGSRFTLSKKSACPECHTELEDMVDHKLYHYVYYGCNNHQFGQCHLKPISETVIDRWAENELTTVTIPEPLVAWAIMHSDELKQVNKDVDDTLYMSLISKRVKAQQKLDKLDDVFLEQDEDNPTYTLEEYNEKKKRFQIELQEIVDKLNEIIQKNQFGSDNAIEEFDFHNLTAHWLNNGDAKTKSVIVGALGSDFSLANGMVTANTSKRAYFLTPTQN